MGLAFHNKRREEEAAKAEVKSEEKPAPKKATKKAKAEVRDGDTKAE